MSTPTRLTPPVRALAAVIVAGSGDRFLAYHELRHAGFRHSECLDLLGCPEKRSTFTGDASEALWEYQDSQTTPRRATGAFPQFQHSPS